MMSNSSNSKYNFYAQIYNHYKTKIFDCQEKYYDWYRQSNNLEKAISKAFKSEDECLKVHSHQHRVGRKVLEQARNIALNIYKENNYSETDLNTFDEIYNKFVSSIRCKVKGFGELAHYDISLRIAKYQNAKYPNCGNLTEVYLHRGTLDGAKAVFNAGHIDKSIKKSDIREGEKISVSHFPSPLNNLSGDHLENLLCIYKEELKKQKISNHKQKYCTKSQTKKNKPCT